jgi:hypothetical protein
MKRLILLLVIALNFIAFPAWAEDEVILDRLTEEQAEELNIVIPNKTPPGFHSITIEVYDDNGVIKDKEIPFCKNLRGEINWDNKCPDVVALASFEQLLKIRVREDLPPYAPAQEPEKTKGLQISLLAALAALAGAKRSSGDQQGSDPDVDDDSAGGESSEPQQEELTSIESGKLGIVEREQGWGDTSVTWRSPLTTFTDHFFTAAAVFFSRYSPLVARTIDDGTYLRAIFGGHSITLLPIAVIFGVKSLLDTQGEAMAPLLLTMCVITALAIFDTLAGAIAATIFLIGTLFAGGIGSRSEALTVLGVMAIFIAPALLASAIRPLRRLILDQDGGWERATDYALTTLLTGWLVEKMVLALNGLSGVQLALTYQARTIAITASILILIRMLGEDVATYLYPARLKKVNVDLPDPNKIQLLASSIIKIGFFILLATPFVGVNFQLLIAAFIFIIPLVASLTFVDLLPKFEKVNYVLPKATLKLVILTIVCSIFAALLQEQFQDPTSFLRWCFVIVAIPGLIFAIIEWFAAESENDWKRSRQGRWIYRVVGVVVLYLTIQIVIGYDFATLVA